MSHHFIWNFHYTTKKPAPIIKRIIAESHELKWEVRFFWPADQIIHLSYPDDALLDIGNYKQKNKNDSYYLLPDCNDNIKYRQHTLTYKPLIEENSPAFGFGQKINLGHLVADQSDTIKPGYLSELVKKIRAKGMRVYVKKESLTYKFPTRPQTKLELSRLEIKDRIYYSACIEGKSLSQVKTFSESLLGTQASCEYITFLKKIVYSQ